MSRFKKTLGSDFFIFRARLAFPKFRQAFINSPILQYFKPICYIRVETNTSGYAIGGVLNYLTLEDLGQWHSVALFSQKMIPAKSGYETHAGELLAIVGAFKTCKHYLEGSQHKVLVLINHKNFWQFMNIKSLSSRQICWAQKLS